MHKGVAALIGVLGTLTVGAWFASVRGWGVTQPVKHPPSIREGSVRMAPRTGRSGTHYFMGRSLRGGGLHHGK